MIPAAEWTAIADEYRRMHADALARWKSMDDLYGRDWWKEHARVAVALLRVMGAMTNAAVIAESEVTTTVIEELIAEVSS
jgi:hypothetical protein